MSTTREIIVHVKVPVTYSDDLKSKVIRYGDMTVSGATIPEGAPAEVVEFTQTAVKNCLLNILGPS